MGARRRSTYAESVRPDYTPGTVPAAPVLAAVAVIVFLAAAAAVVAVALVVIAR